MTLLFITLHFKCPLFYFIDISSTLVFIIKYSRHTLLRKLYMIFTVSHFYISPSITNRTLNRVVTCANNVYRY